MPSAAASGPANPAEPWRCRRRGRGLRRGPTMGWRACPPCSAARRCGSATVRRTPGQPARPSAAGRRLGPATAVAANAALARRKCSARSASGADGRPGPGPCRRWWPAPAGVPAGPTSPQRPGPAAAAPPAARHRPTAGSRAGRRSGRCAGRRHRPLAASAEPAGPWRCRPDAGHRLARHPTQPPASAARFAAQPSLARPAAAGHQQHRSTHRVLAPAGNLVRSGSRPRNGTSPCSARNKVDGSGRNRRLTGR